MIFIHKQCLKCLKVRKFIRESPRDKMGVCGDCWNWGEHPPKSLDLCGGTIKSI